jgi:hypothetical protein
MNAGPSLSTSNAGSNETEAHLTPQNSLSAPEVVLRMGFAGNRLPPDYTGPLKRSLDAVFSILAILGGT